jgi:AraC-like DNA-binding protein
MIQAELQQLSQSPRVHSHQFHQLVIGVCGEAEFEVDGKGDRVDAWHACIVPSAESHCFAGSDDNLILVMNLSEGADGFVSSNVVQRVFEHSGYMRLDGRLQQFIQFGAKEIEHFSSDELLTRHLAAAIVHGLSHRLQLGLKENQGRMLDLGRIDQFIADNLSTKISIFQLSELECISPSHFQRLFKEQVGVPPHQYVLGKRIAKAERFIIEGGKTLGEIAYLCGFSSQAAMSSGFRKHKNISPSQLKHV